MGFSYTNTDLSEKETLKKNPTDHCNNNKNKILGSGAWAGKTPIAGTGTSGAP